LSCARDATSTEQQLYQGIFGAMPPTASAERAKTPELPSFPIFVDCAQPSDILK
jgi:hypothetical protein